MAFAAIPMPAPKFKAWDNSGNPLAGGLLYTYQAGTVIPAATYQDPATAIVNPNPVILDGRGEALVYLSNVTTYKLVLTDANNNTIWSVDQFANPGGFNGIITTAKLTTLGSNGQMSFFGGVLVSQIAAT